MPGAFGSADDLKRRLAGWRAAEQREREARRADPLLSPSEALEAALELCDLAGPSLAEEDAVRRREVAQARAAWRTLRERMGWRPNGLRR